MAQWKKRLIGDMPFYQAETISWLPGIVQGFTTRRGGASAAPFDSLNMSFSVGDSQEIVSENRQRLLADLGQAAAGIATASQVHGVGVAHVHGPADSVAETDALITDTPGLVLMLLFADCVPVYIVDPVHRAVGLAHSGWRGTAKNVVLATVKAMGDTFGTEPGACLAALGPCICVDHYEVGAEVADALRDAPGGKESGSATAVLPKSEFGNTWSVDLRQIIFTQLLQARLRPEYIAVSNECTFRNHREFFSYRRATRAGQKTGRMAAVLGLNQLARRHR